MKPDKEFIRKRFAQKLSKYHQMAQIQQGIAAELATVYQIHFGDSAPRRIYEAGAGTGFLTRYLRLYHPGATFLLNDLTDHCSEWLHELMEGYDAEYLWGDAEAMDLPGELDVVASSSTVQWFSDLAGFIAKAARATLPGGALAVATYGPDNFREVRGVRGDGLDYHTKNEIGRMVTSAGYEILHVSEQTRTLYFDIPLDVLYHIKYTGVNAVMPVHWIRRSLQEFTDRYRRLYLNREGVVPLTYHPIYVVARKLPGK